MPVATWRVFMFMLTHCFKTCVQETSSHLAGGYIDSLPKPYQWDASSHLVVICIGSRCPLGDYTSAVNNGDAENTNHVLAGDYV